MTIKRRAARMPPTMELMGGGGVVVLLGQRGCLARRGTECGRWVVDDLKSRRRCWRG